MLRDDLADSLDAYEFEKHIWGMYAGWSPQALSLPQRDRVRWHLFPEIRMPRKQLALGLEAHDQPPGPARPGAGDGSDAGAGGADFHGFDWTSPSVKLMTLHGSKGLEFPLVFIAALDCMPQRDTPLDDELRVLYVGMTRATEQLVLSAAGHSPMLERVKHALEAVTGQFGSPP